MIEVENLSKFYGNHRAIDGVSFCIGEGTIVGLLGLNGAGKSTVLKILATYLAPTSGRVNVGGFDYNTDLSQLRRSIGFLPDRPPLYDEMSIASFLQFTGKLRGVSANNIQSYVEDALRNTNLVEERDTRLGQLSHGFRQRVGIAQAMIHKPKLLILDEPINGLDPVQIVDMRDLILSLKKEYTVVLSSHILSEITRTCDKILIFDQGKLVGEGSEQELITTMNQRKTLQVVWRDNDDAVFAAIRALPGVDQATMTKKGRECSATIITSNDIRGNLAAAIVGCGAALLALTQVDQGLEDLFLKLVSKGDH